VPLDIVISMVNYWKSPEGIKAYEKIGKPYPVTTYDTDYEQFVNSTRSSDERNRTKRRVTRIMRVQGADGKEYLTYSENETRFNDIGNSSSRFRENIGTYPIPEGHIVLYYDANGEQQSKVDSISDIKTGYSIPFSPQKANQIHKNAVDDVPQRAGRTEYFVQRANDPPVSVETFQDLVNAEFDELYKHGKRVPGWQEEKKKEQAEREQLEAAREVRDYSTDEDQKIRAINLESQITTDAIEADDASNIKEGGQSEALEVIRQEEEENREIAEKIKQEQQEAEERGKLSKKASKK
jgi:hypothetical protein